MPVRAKMRDEMSGWEGEIDGSGRVSLPEANGFKVAGGRLGMEAADGRQQQGLGLELG